jgi:4-diphosphocytidyl-2-C-methyl-D-erythritol kinase
VSAALNVGPELTEPAYAKINLTLRVLGRRPDGYHVLESLVCFARVGDELTLRPGARLALDVGGPRVDDAGPLDQNLVLKAARALAERVSGLTLGHFSLFKRLPAGAGLGGGSSDAAAALRLIAHVNRLSLLDPRLTAAALATGADVPVCLDQEPRWMRGLGEILADPLRLPELHAVLVFPGVPLATKDVFGAFRLNGGRQAVSMSMPSDVATQDGKIAASTLLEWLPAQGNDLEVPAIARLPAIAEVLAAMRAQPECRLARMSGSGSACFAIFPSADRAGAAAQALAGRKDWWVEATCFGGE